MHGRQAAGVDGEVGLKDVMRNLKRSNFTQPGKLGFHPSRIRLDGFSIPDYVSAVKTRDFFCQVVWQFHLTFHRLPEQVFEPPS